MRTRWVVPMVAACALAGIAVPAAVSSAAPHGDRTVLVFFRHTGVSPRSVLGREVQTSVLDEATQLGGQVLVRDAALGAATVRVTAAQARTLASNPNVTAVLPNTLIPGPTVRTAGLHASTTAAGTPAHAPCGTAAKPQLNPEALGNINAVGAATQGYDGAGVTVATIADGVDPANPDLARNPAFASPGSPAGSRVVTYKSFGGDRSTAFTGGAEAFGDVASVAAQGNDVYDLSRLVGPAHPLPTHCDIRILGVAPGASVLALDVFGLRNSATGSAMIQAVNYAVAHGASVINESFGFNNFPDTSVDIVRQADAAAVAAGVTVVVSSGDAGPNNTIGSPASDPAVLTVGATTTYRAYAQLTFGGINALGPKAGYLDNNISSFSSGGIAQDGKTVNLVAPGDLGWSLCSKAHRFFECGGQSVQLFGGTSESAPLTSGAAADVIEAYRKTHGGTAPSPRLVMQILTSTAVDVGAPAVQQGAGMLDVGAAVRLATSLAGTTLTSRLGGVQSDTAQVNLDGLPSSAQSATIQLTNTSSSAKTVQLSTRTFAPGGTNSGTTVVDASTRSHDLTFVDDGGETDVYRRGTFSVPAGTARVQLQAAFGASGNAFLQPVNVSLFAPNGDLAAYSLPQGFANYADLEVAAPQPGRWTVVFFQVRGGGATGITSRVHWKETDLTFAPEGTVTPGSVVLAVGQAKAVRLDVTLPAAPGDGGFSVVVDAGTQRTTIPVTLRTQIPISASGGTFSGVLTGGNGRFGAPGQSNTYSFSVPSGKRDLDVGIALARNPVTKAIPNGDELGAFLIGPSGQTMAYNVNAWIDPHSRDGITVSRFDNLYVASPPAGAWALVLEWFQPLDGWATSINFDGSIAFNTVSVTGDLPTSTSMKVPKAGETFVVHVHNTGVAPMELSRDARLSGTTSMGVKSLIFGALQPLPGAFGVYYLPTGTQSVDLRQTSNVPATFEAASYAGDPILAPNVPAPYTTISSTPTFSRLTYSPPGGAAAGIWVMASDEVGPYPAAGARRGYAIQDVHVQAPAFDPSITSTVPDIVQQIFAKGDRNLPLPLLVAAGATAAIPIRITPSQPVGTVVAGTLFIDQAFPELVPETLGSVPYLYTVGG